MTMLWSRDPEGDTRLGLSPAYSWRVWAFVLSTFIVVHYLLFGIVDNIIDTRLCIGYSPDPLFRFIPLDTRWYLVTRWLYIGMIIAATTAVLVQTYRGVHTPALRWALALCFMTSMRMVTLLTIPLCRITVTPFGPPPIPSTQMLDLHFFSVPFRMFAQNDLVYSGHTAVFLLLLMATRTWFKIARIWVGIYLALMIYGLLATRDHYTVDILLAFPCAFFANFLAVKILRSLNPDPHPPGS